MCSDCCSHLLRGPVFYQTAPASLSIQRSLHARISANNKGFDCGSGCIIFLELAIMFQVRD